MEGIDRIDGKYLFSPWLGYQRQEGREFHGRKELQSGSLRAKYFYTESDCGLEHTTCGGGGVRYNYQL